MPQALHQAALLAGVQVFGSDDEPCPDCGHSSDADAALFLAPSEEDETEMLLDDDAGVEHQQSAPLLVRVLCHLMLWGLHSSQWES